MTSSSGKRTLHTMLCAAVLAFFTFSVSAQLQEVPVPSWFERGRPSEDVFLALRTLADAEAQGLHPEDYHANELSQAFFEVDPDHTEPAMMAGLDEQLTAALVLYLRDLHQGRLNPEVLQHRFKARVVEQLLADGTLTVAQVAREHDTHPNLQARGQEPLRTELFSDSVNQAASAVALRVTLVTGTIEIMQGCEPTLLRTVLQVLR